MQNLLFAQETVFIFWHLPAITVADLYVISFCISSTVNTRQPVQAGANLFQTRDCLF